jgi:hypothetical protein
MIDPPAALLLMAAFWTGEGPAPISEPRRLAQREAQAGATAPR